MVELAGAVAGVGVVGDDEERTELHDAQEFLPVAYIRTDVRSSCPDTVFSRSVGKFVEFSARPPDRLFRVRCSRIIPPVLVHVGELRALVYASDRGKTGNERTYIHFMEEPPILACNPQGDRLFVVGGRYRITTRGIEG